MAERRGVRLLMLTSVVAALMACAEAPEAGEAAKDAGPGAKPAIDLLWPGGAPGAKGDTPADKPALYIVLPPKEKRNGTAVVICPGGGYGGLAMDHEGHAVAEWLRSNGICAFILRYRIAPRYMHPAPLQDAQRAIRTVRYHAAEIGVDPARIGIIGFSAGGHLASSTGTHFDKGDPKAKDPIDRLSCRPDFMFLIYPVISFTEECSHIGSRNNLLGRNPDPKLVELFSNERQVTKDTPPTCLVHANADKGVPPENSILFYMALRKAGVPAEMHIYEKGPHGFGMRSTDPVLKAWTDRCIDWLKTRGLMSRPVKK